MIWLDTCKLEADKNGSGNSCIVDNYALVSRGFGPVCAFSEIRYPPWVGKFFFPNSSLMSRCLKSYALSIFFFFFHKFEDRR